MLTLFLGRCICAVTIIAVRWRLQVINEITAAVDHRNFVRRIVAIVACPCITECTLNLAFSKAWMSGWYPWYSVCLAAPRAFTIGYRSFWQLTASFSHESIPTRWHTIVTQPSRIRDIINWSCLIWENLIIVTLWFQTLRYTDWPNNQIKQLKFPILLLHHFLTISTKRRNWLNNIDN